MAAFASSGFDAERYFSSRPTYNQKIFDLIYAYHDSHRGSSGDGDKSAATVAGGYDTALDLGCGPGQLSHPLLARFRHVIGMDPSAKMLEQARSVREPWKVFAGGRRPPEAHTIEFRQGTGEQTGLEDHSVDLVTAGVAAHLFDWFAESDGQRVWRDLARIMRPHASVCFFGYYCGHVRDANMSRFNELMARIFSDEDKLGPYYRDEGRSEAPAGFVKTFYDPMPHPTGPQWLQEATTHLKLEVDPSLERQTTPSTEPVPAWAKDVLGDEARSPMVMRKPLRFRLGLFRTASGYTKFLEAHPDQVPLVAKNEDACQKWAEDARWAQARLTAAQQLNKDESAINDDEARQYLVDWDQEVDFYFPLAVLLCKRSSQ